MQKKKGANQVLALYAHNQESVMSLNRSFWHLTIENIGNVIKSLQARGASLPYTLQTLLGIPLRNNDNKVDVINTLLSQGMFEEFAKTLVASLPTYDNEFILEVTEHIIGKKIQKWYPYVTKQLRRLKKETKRADALDIVLTIIRLKAKNLYNILRTELNQLPQVVEKAGEEELKAIYSVLYEMVDNADVAKNYSLQFSKTLNKMDFDDILQEDQLFNILNKIVFANRRALYPVVALKLSGMKDVELIVTLIRDISNQRDPEFKPLHMAAKKKLMTIEHQDKDMLLEQFDRLLEQFQK